LQEAHYFCYLLLPHHRPYNLHNHPLFLLIRTRQKLFETEMKTIGVLSLTMRKNILTIPLQYYFMSVTNNFSPKRLDNQGKNCRGGTVMVVQLSINNITPLTRKLVL
jgi:hypothetical protein